MDLNNEFHYLNVFFLFFFLHLTCLCALGFLDEKLSYSLHPEVENAVPSMLPVEMKTFSCEGL